MSLTYLEINEMVVQSSFRKELNLAMVPLRDNLAILYIVKNIVAKKIIVMKIHYILD